jgi:hypothetical protein
MIHFQFLKKGQILTLNEQALSLRLSKGEIWLTKAGDSKDYVLLEGETHNSGSNQHILIEALEDSTLLYSAQTFEFKGDATHIEAGARSAEAVAVEEIRRSASAR